ncbi:hypothetical protein Ancab_004155 [Ancistrocladus abbreviatus]
MLLVSQMFLVAIYSSVDIVNRGNYEKQLIYLKTCLGGVVHLMWYPTGYFLMGCWDSLEFKEATFILDEMIFKGYSPHFSSINKFVDGLCQEGDIESLLVVLSTLANGKLIDAHTWQMAISTVCCKVEL